MMREVGERDPTIQKRKRDLPAVRVAAQRELDAALGGLPEALRIVREQDRRNPRRTMGERLLQIVAARPRVVDRGEIQARAVALDDRPLVAEDARVARPVRLDARDERL